MFNERLKTWNAPLIEELIKKYHFRLKSGVFEDLENGYPIGEYKNRKNIVSDIVTAAPDEVAERMKSLLLQYESLRKKIFVIWPNFMRSMKKSTRFRMEMEGQAECFFTRSV